MALRVRVMNDLVINNNFDGCVCVVQSDTSFECFCVPNEKHGGTPKPQANRVSSWL
jgi:hypothetical protein